MVDELLERMKNVESTFTQTEVTELIAWYCKLAVNDEVRAIAERNEQERTRLLAEKTDATMEQLLSKCGTYTPPTLQVVSYE